MRTADDYIEIAPGRWVPRDPSGASINPSIPRPKVMDGRVSLRLIWAKDIRPESEQAEQSLWGDFLWPGSSHLLSGDAGVGKTTLLYNLVVRACIGEAFQGIPFARPLQVLYLDLETPVALRARKLHSVSEGNPPDGLAFVIAANLEQNMPLLIQMVKEHGFDLVVVDTINEAFGTIDEDDNAEANRQMALIRQLIQETRAAVLLVHHMGKNEAGKKVYRGRGASARAASADVVLNLEAVSDEVIRLEMVKNRWVGGTSKLFLKKVGEDVFEPTEVSGEESVSERIKAQGFIIHLLQKERKPLSTGEIKTEGQAKGFAPATIERALSGLVQVGQVLRVKRGIYGLAELPIRTSITSTPNSDVMDESNEYVTERI